MILRLLLCVILGCSLLGCTTEKQKKAKIEAVEKAKREDMEDMGGDPSFMSFIGRLRKAVAAHDVDTLAPMMTTQFGYSLAAGGEGPGVFQYWDANNVWPQLQTVLQGHFVPKDQYMVAPIEFVTNTDNFHGYRAGIISQDGSWKFAYFVTDSPQ